MQVKVVNDTDTQVTMTVTAEENELAAMKQHILGHFAKDVKVAGFRQGHAPLSVVEKNVDASQLQNRFLEETIESFYYQAVNQAKIRPLEQPEVNITKFVPFTALEFMAKVPVIGSIKLANYKSIAKKPSKIKPVTEKDITGVLEALRLRSADKKDVSRAAQDGDQVIIDFSGVDAKGKSIKGADGKDYPLVLGSNSFIPGFENNLLGLKVGESKQFDLTFPSDYGVKALASQKVIFTVRVKNVQQIIKLATNDAFASKVSPFETLTGLKADIKKQLVIEREREQQQQFESALVEDITNRSKLTVPQVLIDDQVKRLFQDLKQNLVYRGQTLSEFLAAEGKSEEEYSADVLVPEASKRVKAGLVLAEIADKEGLEVSDGEVDARLQMLRGQYEDAAMRKELDKPEARRDISSRILTEKTIAKIVEYAIKN